MENLAQIKQYDNVTREQFDREIYPQYQPAILKGLVSAWPVVREASQGNQALLDYVRSFDRFEPVYTIVGEPSIRGRFFYSEDLSSVNFQRTQGSITAVLEQLVALGNNPQPHAVAIQAANIKESLPSFDDQHINPLLDDNIAPTLWLGNRATVAPHYDVHDNIACVVSGRRRFTLFPPEQVANLYVGPTLNAPGGVPISLVDLNNPDFETFPKFEHALQSASTATLEPGDAIYIPTPWWHAVESLENINLLINYWWGNLPKHAPSPNHSLMHSMLSIAKLNPAQRESWKHFFDYFVFKQESDPSAHLPESLNDLTTSLTDEQQQQVHEFLRQHLKHN